MDKIRAKKEANKLSASVHIGKQGLSEEVLREIKNQVEKRKVVKIRINRNLGGKEKAKEIAKELEKAGVKVAEVRGRTVVVYS